MPFYVGLFLFGGGLIGFLIGIFFKRNDFPLALIQGVMVVIGILLVGVIADTNHVTTMSLRGAAIFFGSYIIFFAIASCLKRLCRKS